MKSIDRWRSGKNVTHLLLDGGTLSVKEDDHGFHNAYVSDLLNGERLFVVEKKTAPHFRFFVDVDYVDDETPLDIEKVCLEIHRIVNLGPCVIAKAHPRQTPKGTKYGVHIIWTETVVDKPSAQSIRIKLLDELGDESWEKIIDASVYSGSGLRMIWSLKNEPGSTPYVPWAKISNTLEKFSNVQPCIEYLNLFSIRTREEFVVVSQVTSSSCSELEEFVRKNLPGQENARVLKISKCKNKRDYWVRTDSRYCDRVKREHKGNHVWFSINPLGLSICQMCQDEECKDWKGRLYRFPSRLIPNERVLDSGSHRVINDYIPDGWKINF
jgi:hypothetical protein